MKLKNIVLSLVLAVATIGSNFIDARCCGRSTCCNNNTSCNNSVCGSTCSSCR